MSGLFALIAVAAVAAVVVLTVRLRAERARRTAAEEKARTIEDGKAQTAADRRRMVAVVAHELRSPVSVILGYHELIAEGMYGDLDERGQEALARIRQAAEHQLRILEGTVDLVSPGQTSGDNAAPVDLHALAEAALADAQAFANAYAVEIQAPSIDGLPTVVADGERLRRALDMVITAAIKSSPGRHITFSADTADDGASFALAGTGLDPERDEPGAIDGKPLRIDTGAGLRIAIARSILGPAGTVRLSGTAGAALLEMRVTVPPAGTEASISD